MSSAPRSQLRRVALALAIMAAALAPAPLRAESGVLLRVLSCKPHLSGTALLRAEVELRTLDRAVELHELQCGAYDPRTGSPLFLNTVDVDGTLEPYTTRVLTAHFPADALHTQCRCVVGAVRRIERELSDEGFGPELPPGADVPPGTAREEPVWQSALPGGAELPPEEPRPAATPPGPALRTERVLLPETSVLAQPTAQARVVGHLVAGEDVTVHGVQAGFKWVRSRSGVGGWIEGDASSADLGAPARVASRLAPLHRLARPGAGPRSDAYCQAVAPGELGDLVFALLPESHAVYVRPVWYALSEDDQEAFVRWASECFDVSRVIDVARGLEVRNLAWAGPPDAARARSER